MRIAVIGGGAIGSLIAAKLVEDGNEVLIHARGQHGAEMALNGLHITGIWNRIISPDEWFVSLDEIEKPPELENYYDQAIITGKSKDTSNLCKIANFFTKGPVLSLQNGIGNLEILHDYFFEKSAVGVTTNAVTKIEPGRIIWVSKGKLEISGNAGQEFESSLNCLSPEFFVKPDEILWNKLLINVAINPIAAMCGVRNGELAKEPLLSQCESIMLEAANIARLSGVMVANDIQLIENLHKVISDTSENICSMLSDVKSGKDTEIDFLCGQVVLRGEKLGVPTPLNSMLLSQIKSLK
jgi:2-dehydropantoate 2-reductase